MLHKAWSSIEEVPYCFWRSSVKFQGHSAKKNRRFWPKLGISRLKNRRFESNLSKITRPVAAIKSLRFALLKVIHQISRLHGSKNRRILPKLGVSGLLLQFELTNVYEMIHKAWSNIEEMPYCFWGSSVKFLGHTAQKIVDFDPNWAFPDCNSNLNSPMGMKWCTKLEVA